jgi:hypothetical protein
MPREKLVATTTAAVWRLAGRLPSRLLQNTAAAEAIPFNWTLNPAALDLLDRSTAEGGKRTKYSVPPPARCYDVSRTIVCLLTARIRLANSNCSSLLKDHRELNTGCRVQESSHIFALRGRGLGYLE